MSSQRESRTLYFLDTEFIEDGSTIDLISIGVRCEDGREFYAESAEADLSQASEWVQANVLPHLDPLWRMSRAKIAGELLKFTNHGAHRPQFWAYYADYDWVAVCQLYGTMMDLPKSWPRFCMDIKQEAVRLGDPTLPEQSSTEHHALADARWNAEVHAFLLSHNGGRQEAPDV